MATLILKLLALGHVANGDDIDCHGSCDNVLRDSSDSLLQSSSAIEKVGMAAEDSMTSVHVEAKQGSTPKKSTTCADIGVKGNLAACTGWVLKGNHCGKGWADTGCPLSCGVCQLCSLGEWGDWSDCSATCAGGGQVREQDKGDCDDGATESRQCNTQACPEQASCTLASSDRITVDSEPGKVIENLRIDVSGAKPAITISNSANVIIRNVYITHTGEPQVVGVGDEAGPGIYFTNSPNILIENVKVELVRHANPYASTSETCQSKYCGPFTYDMKYSYNIHGRSSASPRLNNVHVIGGSSGFWCKECDGGIISHFKAEDMHGPYPRGQCVQVVMTESFVLEDFYCKVNNEIGFTEDTISIWKSPYGIVRRGLIDGGNAPNGVGVMYEMSDHSVCEDVDVTNNGKGCFSAYGADNVTFLRTRARDNHGTNKACAEGRGYCMDEGNNNHCAEYRDCEDCGDANAEKRIDSGGGIWFSGDYNSVVGGGIHQGNDAKNIVITEGVFFNMAGWDDKTQQCKDVDLTSWEVSGANRQESYKSKSFSMKEFELRTPFEPAFCWSD